MFLLIYFCDSANLQNVGLTHIITKKAKPAYNNELRILKEHKVEIRSTYNICYNL